MQQQLQSKRILAPPFSVVEVHVLVLAPPWQQIGAALQHQLHGMSLSWQLTGLRLHQHLLMQSQICHCQAAAWSVTS